MNASLKSCFMHDGERNHLSDDRLDELFGAKFCRFELFDYPEVVKSVVALKRVFVYETASGRLTWTFFCPLLSFLRPSIHPCVLMSALISTSTSPSIRC